MSPGKCQESKISMESDLSCLVVSEKKCLETEHKKQKVFYASVGVPVPRWLVLFIVGVVGTLLAQCGVLFYLYHQLNDHVSQCGCASSYQDVPDPQYLRDEANPPHTTGSSMRQERSIMEDLLGPDSEISMKNVGEEILSREKRRASKAKAKSKNNKRRHKTKKSPVFHLEVPDSPPPTSGLSDDIYHYWQASEQSSVIAKYKEPTGEVIVKKTGHYMVYAQVEFIIIVLTENVRSAHCDLL